MDSGKGQQWQHWTAQCRQLDPGAAVDPDLGGHTGHGDRHTDGQDSWRYSSRACTEPWIDPCVCQRCGFRGPLPPVLQTGEFAKNNTRLTFFFFVSDKSEGERVECRVIYLVRIVGFSKLSKYLRAFFFVCTLSTLASFFGFFFLPWTRKKKRTQRC